MALRLAQNRSFTSSLFRHLILSLPPLRRLSSAALPALRPSTDADQLSQFLLHEQNPFQSIESFVQLQRLSLSADLLHQTLLRLRHNPQIALAFFDYSKSAPSLTSYNLLIDILAKAQQFDLAWQLLVEMGHRSIKPTSQTFSILIRRLISAGLTHQAIRVFDDMSSFVGEQVGYSEFHLLLDTLCKYGYVKVAAEVFREKRHGFGADVSIYTVLVYGWCKVGRIDMAERLLREMVELGIEPNVGTYNVLLNGVCRRTSLGQEPRFEKTVREAERVLEEMQSTGIEPDVTSYSIVLHVYSKARKPQLTIDKLNLMKAKGICPTMGTYTEVVKCLCSCGWLDDAEALLSEMVRSGVCPSPETYTCFFNEFGERKDVKAAMKLYRKMKEDGLYVPNMQMYNMLLGMFMNFNRIGVVREIWDDMKASGAGPDLDSFTILIQGLCEKQKWTEACQFFAEMIDRGLLPQKATIDMLQEGLTQSDMSRTWGRLKKKLNEDYVTSGSEIHDYDLEPRRP